MSVTKISDVEFGAELGPFTPDTGLANTGEFADMVGWGDGPRFKDHDKARKEGFPSAIVPGIMGMGFLTTLIHDWAPNAQIRELDTVFRAPMLADQPCLVSAVVTDIDEETGIVELDLQIKNEADETRLFGNARIQLPLE